MNERARWVAKLTAEPDDPNARQVFGDWLREQGDDDAAEWLELEGRAHAGSLDHAGARRMQHLQRWVPPAERIALTRAPVERCPVGDSVGACRWERLEVTTNVRVRRCAACGEDIPLVESAEEAQSMSGAWRPHVVAPGVRAIPAGRPARPRWEPERPRPIGTRAPPDRTAERRDRPRPVPTPDTPVQADDAEDPPTRPWWRRLFGR